MSGFRIEGDASSNVMEVDAGNNAKVALSNNPIYMGGARNFSENDPGLSWGTPYLMSPETDDEYRLRVSNDVIFDEENFTYTAQNMTKHQMYATTFVPSWTLTGFNTNPTNINTAASAMLLRTNKTFALVGTETISFDIEGAFTFASGTVFPANSTVEFGFGIQAVTTPYDCFDGVYVRTNSSGSYLVVRNNSATDSSISAAFKDTTGAATWFPTSGRKYQFILYWSTREVEIWISDPVADVIFLAAQVTVPAGYGSPTASTALPIFVRQYHSGTPSVAGQFTVSRNSVRRGGTNIGTTLNVLAARAYESNMQPGSLASTQIQAIASGSITRPGAAVPSNTTSTLASLGGIYVETGTLAIGTDAILMSYLNPALPVAVAATYAAQRRLRIDGVSICSGVTTAFATGGFQKHFYIAYGSTSLSLAGVATDTATTKAYRRIHIPIVQYYTATHAPGAPNSASTFYALQTPIYINPGEYVALVTYHQGTVGTTGVITHSLQFDYAWE